MNLLKSCLLIILIAMMPKLSFAEKAFFFEGQIDFPDKEFNVVFNVDAESSVTAKVEKISETDYHFSLDIEHLKTPLFDLLSKIESSIEFVQGEGAPVRTFSDTTLRGAIWSQYSLIDYKPIRELSGNFEIRDKKLFLKGLSVGRLTCNGYVGMVPPFESNFDVHLSGVDMKDFLRFWGLSEKYESSGGVFGDIRVSGTLNHLTLKGNLESRHGFVQTLDYDVISLNIEGVYPHMKITRSTVSKSDGVSFAFDGPFNLSDKANFKKQIKALTIAPLVSDSGSELEWTIKRLNPKDSDTTELKYRLNKEDVLGTGVFAGGEIDMFGIERTRKF